MKSAAPSSKGIPAMGATAADGPFAADRRFRFKEGGVEVGKILQLQSWNFLTDEMFDCLQCRHFLAVHQGEGVADILGAPSPANAMDIIFRMFRDIIIDDVTDAGDIEPARGYIGSHHHFVFAALKSFECLD